MPVRPFEPTHRLQGQPIQLTGWHAHDDDDRVEYVTEHGGVWESRWTDRADLEPLEEDDDELERAEAFDRHVDQALDLVTVTRPRWQTILEPLATGACVVGLVVLLVVLLGAWWLG